MLGLIIGGTSVLNAAAQAVAGEFPVRKTNGNPISGTRNLPEELTDLFPAVADGENCETDEREVGRAAAQPTNSADYKLGRGAREYLFEFGFAPFDPTKFAGSDEYNLAGRSTAMINFRIGRVIGTGKNITYTYLFGFTPLVVAFGNEVKNPLYLSPPKTPNVPHKRRETSYGAGFSPIDFRFTFLAKRRVKPFAQAGAGMLVFSKSLPLPESRRLQFTGDFGDGVPMHQSQNRVVTLGYRYFHVSNGNLMPKIYNVGYNAQTFYFRFSFFK